MFTHLFTIALLPTIFFLWLPLLPLAILTSTLAFTTLAIRVVAVHVELGFAILRHLISPNVQDAPVSIRESGSKPISTSSGSSDSLAVPNTRPPSQSLYSFSSSGSLAPRSRRSSNATIQGHQLPHGHPYGQGSTYGAPATTSRLDVGLLELERDFEGVGGWRDETEDPAAEEQWVGMNSRLELPAAGMRTPTSSRPGSGAGSGGGSSSIGGTGTRHKRSWTSGAVRLGSGRRMSGASSRPRSGEAMEAAPAGTGSGSGTMSPEEGLTMAKESSGPMEIGMNVGRPRTGHERRKSGSSGSLSSANSHRTMMATTGTGWMAP